MTKHNTAVDDDFRNQFDELGLKPPKNSMPGLERELIIDYWRKHINTILSDYIPKSKVIEARIDEMHRAADAHRLAGGKGLPKGFQRRMNELQEIKNTLGIGGA